MRGSRHFVAVAAAFALAASLTAGLATGSSADTVEQSTLGGPLHAEMYPSGLDTAPDGTVVIADTGNNRVARYNANGSLIWSVGTHGDGVNQFDNPRDVAVDAANNIYVADTRNSRIVKLSSTGAWLGETTGPATAFSFPLGVSVKGSKVYVGDTGRARVVVLDQALSVLQEVTANGVCANLNDNRDAQADSAGNIYVAGYKTNQILKFAPDGTCIKTWGSTGTGNSQFRTPYGVDLANDPVTGQELVYVADGLNNRVQVFRTDGSFVTAFGTFGEPTQVGTFTTMRRVAVAKDGTGNVWAADLWGDRIERWDRTASGFTYNRTIGAVMPAPTENAVFHEPRGMAFTPNGNLWVTDTVHHSFQKFNAAGDLLSTCGERAAEGTQLGQFNWPRGIAVDPQTGNLWIADTKQHQLQVLKSDCTAVGPGTGFVKNLPAGADTRSFNWPYDIAIRNSDRFAFVVDTQNHRIKAYDVANAVFPADNKGPLPTTVFGTRGTGANNFKWPSGVAVGPDGHVYVADRGNNRIQEFSYTEAGGFAFQKTWNASPVPGSGSGTLNEPEGVAVDATGRVIVADTQDNQMVVMRPDRIVESTVNALHEPTAVEVGPTGLVYLSDTYADVVRVYSLTAGPPPDTTAPTGVFSTPASGEQVPVGPVTLTGTASDNQALGTVYVALKRNDNNTWLHENGTYGAFAWLPVTVANPGATTSGWSFSTTLPVTGGYFMQLRVDDAAGNQNDPKPSRTFSAVSAGNDAATPTGTVTSPANNAAVAAPVTLTGTASDDKGIASVKLGIKQNSTGFWWNGTSWQAQAAKVNAVLQTPGGASTTWSYTLNTIPTGSYGFSTDITDTAGKLATGAGKPAWRNFSVTG
jgi:DNA-binding beta-propeller fold protein YncE